MQNWSQKLFLPLYQIARGVSLIIFLLLVFRLLLIPWFCKSIIFDQFLFWLLLTFFLGELATFKMHSDLIELISFKLLLLSDITPMNNFYEYVIFAYGSKLFLCGCSWHSTAKNLSAWTVSMWISLTLGQICRWLTSFYKLWTLEIQSCAGLAFKVQWQHWKKLFVYSLW